MVFVDVYISFVYVRAKLCILSISLIINCLLFGNNVLLSVADTGFREGGFHSNNARAERARKSEATPTRRLKPRPFSSVLERNFLPSLSIDPFLTEIVAKAC